MEDVDCWHHMQQAASGNGNKEDSPNPCNTHPVDQMCMFQGQSKRAVATRPLSPSLTDTWRAEMELGPCISLKPTELHRGF